MKIFLLLIYLWSDNITIPCSLKFSRLKNFTDFAGQRTPTKKFLQRNFKFITDARRGWKTRPRKFYPRKFGFEQNLAKPQNINPRNFRLYGIHYIFVPRTSPHKNYGASKLKELCHNIIRVIFSQLVPHVT